MEDQNHLANAIVDSMPKAPDGPADEAEAPPISTSDMAIEELFTALENKDTAGFRDAFRAILETMNHGE